MSDPRATTRGSKTAAVVMLVVFVQVLIVAILGLGKIGSGRQEARRVARADARHQAGAALKNVLEHAQTEVLAALNDVRALRDFPDLQNLRRDPYHGRHADLIKTVYQVDPATKEVYWIDGDHAIFVPPPVRAEKIEQAKLPEEFAVLTAKKEAYEEAQHKPVTARVRAGVPFFRDFPYREDSETRHPLALSGIGRLVREAANEADVLHSGGGVDQAYRDLEEVLLAAIEVTALNEDRREDIPRGDLANLRVIPELVEGTVVALLRGKWSPMGEHVEAYRRAREHFEGGEDQLSLRDVLPLAYERLEKMQEKQDVVSYGDQLLGLVPWAQVPGQEDERHLVVLMSPEALLHLVKDCASDAIVKGLNLKGVLVPTGPNQDVAALSDEDLKVEPDDVAAAVALETVPALRLPYRLELRHVLPPTIPSEGPGEFFYWGIIGLSALGLGLGGWVLMRIYAREVRLARLKADFVSNLSHELKTPLTSIGMWTELLQDERMTDEDDRKEALAVLAQESERLQSIVHRMLDTAKREARGEAYKLAPGDLNEVVGRSAERFRRITTDPGLDLVIELHPEPLPAMLDLAAIDDVVANLVSNAWKYKHGDEARVEVRTARRWRKVELTVADDGLGIPRRDRRKVFDMFYRAEAYLTRAAGTGLGLSLVRTAVRAHRGSIRIEPGLNGRGTLFRIRFPLHRKAERKSPSSSVSLGSMSPNSEAS